MSAPPHSTVHGWWGVMEEAWSLARNDRGARAAFLNIIQPAIDPKKPIALADLLPAVQALSACMLGVLEQLHIILKDFTPALLDEWVTTLANVYGGLSDWDGQVHFTISNLGLSDTVRTLKRRAWVIVAGREIYGVLKNRPYLSDLGRHGVCGDFLHLENQLQHRLQLHLGPIERDPVVDIYPYEGPWRPQPAKPPVMGPPLLSPSKPSPPPDTLE